MRNATCDHCGQVITEDRVPFTIQTSQPKGKGWISSGGDDWDFCSWRCIQKFAKAQRTEPAVPALTFSTFSSPFGKQS